MLFSTNSYTSTHGFINNFIYQHVEFSIPPEKSQQTPSHGRHGLTHTHAHTLICGRTLWWHSAQLSLHYNPVVFYSQFPLGCDKHFRSCVPVFPPLPVSTLTGRRCQWSLNVTAQVNLCPAISASIEGPHQH